MIHPRNENTSKPAADALAIGLSGLCLIHCLAMPALILVLPATLGLDRFHWQIHAGFFVTALVLTIVALFPARIHGQRAPRQITLILPLAIVGLAFMGSALVEAWHQHERLLTTIGVVILGAAHALNWWSRAKAHKAIHLSDN